MNRYKPTGWKNDNYRHSLAARGIRTSYAGFLESVRAGVRSQVPSQTKQLDLQIRSMGSRGPVDPAVVQLTEQEKIRYAGGGPRAGWYAPLYDALNTEPMPGETMESYKKRVESAVLNISDPISRNPKSLGGPYAVGNVPLNVSSDIGNTYNNLIYKFIKDKVKENVNPDNLSNRYMDGKFVSSQEYDTIMANKEQAMQKAKQEALEAHPILERASGYGQAVKKGVSEIPTLAGTAAQKTEQGIAKGAVVIGSELGAGVKGLVMPPVEDIKLKMQQRKEYLQNIKAQRDIEAENIRAQKASEALKDQYDISGLEKY